MYANHNGSMRALAPWSVASLAAPAVAGGGGTIAGRTHCAITFIDDEGSHEGCNGSGKARDQAQGPCTMRGASTDFEGSKASHAASPE